MRGFTLTSAHSKGTIAIKAPKLYPETPDGRYFIVRGRLWRATNPALDEAARQRAVHDLMKARGVIRTVKGNSLKAARRAIDEAKRRLGERGPVWWDDGAPDYNRHLARNTPYAEWYAALNSEEANA